MTPLILHTSGLVAADLDTMTLYIGTQEHTICTMGDIVRLASSGIGDINTTLAALDVANQMIAAQSVVVKAHEILAGQRDACVEPQIDPKAILYSFAVSLWPVARLWIPF